ncbi:MAG: EamA family transporter [Hyphomicrobiales bacterium]|nr:EamA family transporter [Hyphomicrobiales bacterium]MCY4033024.1 EamA family transporter [Hyphomicrobiales bacterium]
MKPLHIFYAVLISAIWGTNFLITKVGLQELPPIFFTCLRYSAIVFPLIFFIKRDGLPWDLILKIGISLGTLTFTLAFIGIKLGVPAGLTSLLMQTQVIFTLILSAFILRDVPGVAQQIGVTISAAGVGLLVWSYSQSPTFTGLMFVLAGALCSGVTKILMKQGGQYDTFRLMIWMSLVPPVPLFLLSMIFESGQFEALQHVTYRGVGAILFNSFVSTVLGFGLMGYLVKIYSPNMVAPYAFLVPVFGLAGGFLFLDETLDIASSAAVVIIMGGLLYPKYMAPLLAKLSKSSRV